MNFNVATVVERSLSRDLLQAAIDLLTVPAIRIGLCIYTKKEDYPILEPNGVRQFDYLPL